MPRCPGQDMRYWIPDDIFYVCCPYCNNEIEFWKDEPFRLCRSCQKEVRNPRIDLGCAKWCKFADQCLGKSVNEQLAAEPVIEKLKVLVEKGAAPAVIEQTIEITRLAELLLTAEGGDPCQVKTAALLVAFVAGENDPLCTARELLEQTIVSAEENQAILQLLQEVLSAQPAESLEAAIVSDARTLSDDSRLDEDREAKLLTEGGRMMAALRRKKKEGAQ